MLFDATIAISENPSLDAKVHQAASATILDSIRRLTNRSDKTGAQKPLPYESRRRSFDLRTSLSCAPQKGQNSTPS